MIRPACGTAPAAAQSDEPTLPRKRLTTSLRPGVQFPDWSVVAAASAQATLIAMLEVAWARRAWQEFAPDEDAVRCTALELYRELGRAPASEEIARRSGMTVARVEVLLRRLAGRDLVVLEGGQIIGAYPLTDRATEHRVRIEGRAFHAMCAIDALGVGAMYGMDTTLESRCRLCQAPIGIATGDDGRRLAGVSPAEAVVFAGIDYQAGCAATSLCTTIAFFCGDAHLSAWRSSQSPEGPGFRLSLEEAFQVGRAIFGPVLASPASTVRSETAS